jgi:hypothetical protein
MPSDGYIATRKHTGEENTGPFSGPAVDYINSDTDIEVEKIADGADANAGVILTVVAAAPGATEYTLDSSVSPPRVTLGTALVAGDVLKVRRKTTRGSREVDFVQGSTLTEADLDKATKQGIYLAEEAIDRAKDANDLYGDMSSGYTSTTLPVPGTTNNTLVSDSEEWVPTAPAATRTALGLGTAALVDTGTATDQVPLNTTAAALGTAAYVDTGTATDEVPLNTTAAALASAAYVATGTTTGTIPVLIATNALPAVSGVNLTNLAQPQAITIRHAYLSDGLLANSGSAHALSGTLAANRWHIRPLTDILVHTINGVTDDLGITLQGTGNDVLPTGGVGAEIIFTETGTYEISFHSSFFRCKESVARLVDLNDSSAAESVVIQGTSGLSMNNNHSGMSIGTAVINIVGVDLGAGTGLGKDRALLEDNPNGGAVTSACRRFSLQFALGQEKDVGTTSNKDVLGDGFLSQISDTAGANAAYITNVFAWIDIRKLA